MGTVASPGRRVRLGAKLYARESATISPCLSARKGSWSVTVFDSTGAVSLSCNSRVHSFNISGFLNFLRLTRQPWGVACGFKGRHAPAYPSPAIVFGSRSMIIAWSKTGCESADWTRSDEVGKVIGDTQARSKSAFLSRRQAFHVARSGSLSTSRKVCCEAQPDVRRSAARVLLWRE